ncbi:MULTISPECIES: TM2 domain-containing protein [unclassified Pseudoalteromonas]|uniref:TM2 domain-containing protein n=1 Tax=unclassified Pseudoalteromonas TaxID=194690 RepID=UPI003014BCF5
MDEHTLSQQEEAIREEVARLSPTLRKQYYQLETELLKDPDTYAVLNYFFAAGLHHFYLGKTMRGMFNLLLMLVGLALLPFYGWVLIVLVLLIELPQLFQSQAIVRQHNIDAMRQVLREMNTRQSEKHQRL